MRFQTTLEGAECLRRSDAGLQSVPGARRSDEERAVTNRRTTRRWRDKGRPLPQVFVRHKMSLVHKVYAGIEIRVKRELEVILDIQ